MVGHKKRNWNVLSVSVAFVLLTVLDFSGCVRPSKGLDRLSVSVEQPDQVLRDFTDETVFHR